MMIMVINIGTSSIKCAVFEDEQLKSSIHVDNTDVLAAVDQCLSQAQRTMTDVTVFAFRLVHGGWYFRDPVIITPQVWQQLEEIKQLAPLHNPITMQAMNVIRQHLPSTPCVAVFDTGFHRTMPDVASRYALPDSLVRQFHLYRYGFHGLAHASMLHLYADQTQTPVEQSTLITVQLGSGCSVCAIDHGKSIDCSMGFSPLEGLISRTRTGDIDPTIIPYLCQQMKTSPTEILDILNHDSGLKGISQTDGDIRQIQAQIELHNPLAMLALEMFIYRIQKYIGAYSAILPTPSAVVFGGGISEHNSFIIQRICEAPGLQLILDPALFNNQDQQMNQIHAIASERSVWIAQVNEELEIAKQAKQLLLQQPELQR